MADHEGWYLKANVDISGLLQANKATVQLASNLKKIDAGFSGLRPNDSLAKSIKASDIATASYIERLKSTGKNYEADKEKAKLYKTQIDRLTKRQQGLVTELGHIADKSGKASDAYNIQKARINQTATAINNFKSDLNATRSDMSKIKPTAFNVLTANAKKLTSAGDKMKTTLRDGFDHLKGGAISAAAGVGTLAAATFKGAKAAGNLQQTYREVNNLAVLGGEKQRAVTKAVAEMQKRGRDISIKYGKSQQEIASGYEDLIKRGYSTKQALGSLTTEIQASVASGDSFKDVTSVSSQVLDAFGMRANSTTKMLRNTRRVVNELAYSADATSTGFSDIGTAMSYVGTVAKANKVSLSETASALGVLSNNGLESDKAGTALRATINGLTNQINKIGKKNSIFDKLGIKKSEMVDAHGNLKSLSNDMGVLYKHIQEHSHGGSEQNGFFRSIFGTSGMNGAVILAKSSKEVEKLTKRTQEAGKTGSYVAKLAAKNMGTAQGSAASAKQAVHAFTMTLGNAALPAINKASNALAKFLLSKDGKAFQKDVGGAVSNVATALVNFVKWASTHKGEMKAIGGAILAGYTATKGLEFVSFLGDVKQGILELRGTSGIIDNLAGSLTKLNNVESAGNAVQEASGSLRTSKGVLSKLSILKRKKGPASVVKAGKAVKSPGLIRRTVGNAKATIKDIPYMLPGSGAVRAVAAKPVFHPIRTLKASRLGQASASVGGKLATTKLGGAVSKAGSLVKGLGTGVAGVGVATSAGFDIYQAIKAKNKKQKFTKFGEGIGTALGGGIGLALGGPAGAAVGTVLGKLAGGWAGRLVSGFRKSKFGKAIKADFGQAWHSVSKTTKRSIGKMMKDVKSLSGHFGKDFKAMDKATKPLQNFFKAGFVAVVRTSLKFVSSTLRRGIKVIAGIFHAFTSTVKLVSDSIRGIGTVANDMIHGKWHKAWKDFQKFGGAAIKDFKGVLSGLWKAVKNTFGWIGDTVGSVWDFFVTHKSWQVNKQTTHAPSVSGSAKTNQIMLKAHAKGTHGALVGEAGPELAYKPYAGRVRLLGANGPEFTRVRAGERILNARDTRKVLSGGLGRGLILKGYASGTTRLNKTTKKVTNNYKKINNDSSKQLTSLVRKNRSNWSKISSQTNKLTNKTRKNAIADYKQMHTGISKQMENMHSSVIKTANATSKGFGKALNKSVGYAQDAMSGTMKEMNKGINGIDKVLGQFGGNGQVIKPVRFATGTGKLARNTFAMVNDAPTGPRQEAIVKGNGDIWIPRGNNRQLMLEKDDAVLNGSQTQELARMMGLRHFAKGSGVSHSQLKKIAARGQNNPAQSFANMFNSQVKAKGSVLDKGTTNLGKNSATHFGVPWSTAMWQVINDAIGSANGKGGTREAFLKYAQSTFEGVPYQMGAASKRLSDCSGMVMQALRHFGISIGRTTVAMQHSAGVQYLGKNLSKTVPGDLVIFGHGTGAAGHVGIIKNPARGTMFNETPPHARVTSIGSDTGMGYGFYRVRGLHNATKSAKHAKADKRLVELAKHELGNRAIKWIKDNLGDDFGSLGSFKITGDLRDRARALAGGLKKLDPRATKNGIAAVLGNWNFESGGLNPGAVNSSGGASGLGQWLGGRKANLIAFARKHGTSWKNAGTQLSFAVKGEGSDSSILRSILEGRGSVASLANKFSAEWERGGYNAQHVQGALEIRKALGYAKGGNHNGHTPFIAGEHGPELITANGPVHIDTHEQTKQKVRNLANEFKPRRVTTRTGSARQPITINLNFNGPIGGSEKDMRRIANVARREVARAFEDLLDHGEGADESLY